jgi:uncharacterized membrane protein
MKAKIIVVILILLSIITQTYSQSQYADLTFIIDSQGNIITSGIDSSNEFALNTQSPEFTSKKGKIWTLNITSENSYETFLFETIFPQGSEISYIKTTPTFRIDQSNGQLSIIGRGENKPITIIVQYEINEKNISSSYFSNPLLVGSLGILFGLLLSFLFTKRYKNKKEQKAIKKEVDIAILPERQKEIINILKIKTKITQKELEEIMQIPKASISRNVKTLELKEILKKEKIGNTNYISLR